MRFTFAPESRPLEGYAIKRAIHRGGFGEVYYAISDAGKEVALKLLHNNMEVELRGVTQCLNLKHPNLVTIFDIRQDSEHEHWIVMEYVGGQSLYDVLRKHPSGMPLPEILAWLDGMTAGLSFLHDRGLVHRDLKPANIFSDAGIVKIGDVGLSKYISDSRRSAQTQSVGTVYYMAPEVARGRYGREVDVYSMGIMLCEMMTGHVPFEGETTAEILMKHLTAEPDLSRLPPDVRKVLADALEKDPARRIASVDQLRRRFVEAITATHTASLPQASVTLSQQRQPGAEDSAGRSGATPSAQPTAAHSGAAARLQHLWNERVPYPLKWMLTIAFLMILLTGTSGAGSPLGGIIILSIVLGALGAWLFPAAPPKLRTTDDDARSHSPVAATAFPSSGASAPAVFASDKPSRSPQTAAPVILRNTSPTTRRMIPLSQRLVTITSSLSMSMISILVICLVLYIATPALPGIAEALFFGFATLICSWAIIIPSSLMEGTGLQAWYRRITLGGFGALAGLVTGKMAEFLMLSESTLLKSSGHGYLDRLRHLATDNQTPTLTGFVIFLSLLFFVRRWWFQADSFRKDQFRTSSAIASALVAILLAKLMAFPTAFAGTLALAISVVVQLSSAWTPLTERYLDPSQGQLLFRRGRQT